MLVVGRLWPFSRSIFSTSLHRMVDPSLSNAAQTSLCLMERPWLLRLGHLGQVFTSSRFKSGFLRCLGSWRGFAMFRGRDSGVSRIHGFQPCRVSVAVLLCPGGGLCLALGVFLLVAWIWGGVGGLQTLG